MNIQVNILSDDQFDGLGVNETRGADISDSLGFADVYSRRVFVRNTGIAQLNNYLVNHELEHLFEDEAAHEDLFVSGIRHKKIRDFLAPVADLVLGSKGIFTSVANSLRESKSRRPPQEQPQQQPRNVFQSLGQAPRVAGSQPTPVGSNVVGRVGEQGLRTGQGLQQLSPELRRRTSGFFANRNPTQSIGSLRF